MALSKARMRERKRLDRAAKNGTPVYSPAGVKLSQTQLLGLLSVDERKQVLKEIALSPTQAPVTAGQRVAAVKELNLMDHLYDQGAVVRDVHVVFVIGKGYQAQGKALCEALPEVKLLEGESAIQRQGSTETSSEGVCKSEAGDRQTG